MSKEKMEESIKANKQDKLDNKDKKKTKVEELLETDPANFVMLLDNADKDIVERLGIEGNFEVLLLFENYELVYDSGDFFVQSSNIYDDKLKKKKKITKKMAQDLINNWLVGMKVKNDINQDIKKEAPKQEIVKNKEQGIKPKAKKQEDKIR